MTPALTLALVVAAQGEPLVLTADDAVALAIETSGQLSRLEQRVREEEAWRSGALRLENPELRVRHFAPEHLANGTGWLQAPWGQPGDDHPLNGARVDLRWQPPGLDSFGPRQTEGDQRIERRRAQLADAREDLEEEVRVTHARILYLERRLQLAEDAVALSSRTEQLVGRLREEALATVLDVSLSQLDAFDAVADREARKRELQDERLQLRSLIGVAPLRPLELAGGDDERGLCRLPTEPPAVLTARATEGSFRLRALDAERRAVETERDAYVLDRVPWFEHVQASVIPGDGNDDTTVGLAVGVTLPVLDLRFDDEERASARAAALSAETRVARRRLQSRVRRAYERLAAQVALVELYGNAQGAVVEDGLKQVEKALEVGQLDASQVALVQRRALRAKRDALDARWECERAALRLRRLTGTATP